MHHQICTFLAHALQIISMELSYTSLRHLYSTCALLWFVKINHVLSLKWSPTEKMNFFRKIFAKARGIRALFCSKARNKLTPGIVAWSYFGPLMLYGQCRNYSSGIRRSFSDREPERSSLSQPVRNEFINHVIFPKLHQQLWRRASNLKWDVPDQSTKEASSG